ncbi:MAG: hypothetical protein JW734_05455 [Candidatus Omnitrophica bacterium]|nr:hypothetical protein [Candidatus Omnitrophota bacterium]
MNREKWARLSFAQQLGNIGSEIARARYWEEKNDILQRERSLTRTLELLDLTLTSSCRTSSQLKEIGRFREIVGGWLLDNTDYNIKKQSLEDYCTQFAMCL